MERKFVETPTYGTIAYREAGQGPVALYIHGVFLDGALWRHQVEGLADLRRGIAIDLLAHGGSATPPGRLTISVQAAMVAEFLDALGLDRVDLVGNDSGGAVSQLLAVHHPQRVRSLTLTNSDVHDNFPPEAFLPIQEIARAGELATMLPLLATDPGSIRAALATSLEDADARSDAELLSFFAPFTDPAHASALQQYIAEMEPSELVSIEDQLGTLTTPTLLVWATDDVFFPTAWAEWLARTIPGVQRTVWVEGARLFFPLERPASLIDALRTFWGAQSD